MATFQELIDEIEEKIDQSYLADGETSSRVARAINRAIKYYQSERFWFNEASTTITLTNGNPVVPNIPSDLLYVIENGGMAINYSSTRYPVRRVSIAEYDLQNYEGLGLPSIYKEVGGQFTLYYYPDQDYLLELRYIKSYDELVNSSDSNDWTNNAERLIVSKALEDLYLDARHDATGGGLYDRYVQKTRDEFNQLKERNFSRVSTGTLVTDKFVSERDGYNGYYW